MTHIRRPVFESEDATVWEFYGPLLGSKHFLVLDHRYDVTLVIDSGFGASEVVAVAREIGRETVGIYLTHGHFDHSGGASQISRDLKCPVVLNVDDQKTINSSNFLLKILGYSVRMQLPELTSVNGDYSNELVSFVNCPGHTPGSVLIRCGSLVFTGDSVYANRIDAVTLPQQDNDLLRKSLLASLPVVTAAACIFPGHGPNVAGCDLVSRNHDLRTFLGMGVAG